MGKRMRTLVRALMCAVLTGSFSAGAAVQYTYDNLNRLTAAAYDNGVSISYRYDAAGNLLAATTTSTLVADTTPNSFSFDAVTGAGLAAQTESAAITVSGITAPVAISVSNGQYQINGGTWTSTAGTVSNGDTVKVRVTASGNGGGTTTATLTIGAVSASFAVTTATASLAGLDWPINCIPGQTCNSSIGYPDPDGNGVAFNCAAPGYVGHQGTDISITLAQMDAGVDVLASESGEVLWVFDGKYDRCPNASEPDCQAPVGSGMPSDGYRVCTPLGPYCPVGAGSCSWCFDGGNVVVIKHDSGSTAFATRYDHLKKNSITVRAGDRVSKGQVIAKVGSAGNSTGPHLHFEVWGTTFYDPVDPWQGQCNLTPSAKWYDPVSPWSTLTASTGNDCLFNWAEDTYPTLFTPTRPTTQTFGSYTLRHYTQTNNYLAISGGNAHLYYYAPTASSNALLDLGLVSTWKQQAGCTQ